MLQKLHRCAVFHSDGSRNGPVMFNFQSLDPAGNLPQTDLAQPYPHASIVTFKSGVSLSLHFEVK
jgi:hypothetical protein